MQYGGYTGFEVGLFSSAVKEERHISERSRKKSRLTRVSANLQAKVVVVGGGYIGCEVGAGLNLNGLDVTIVYPEKHLSEFCPQES